MTENTEPGRLAVDHNLTPADQMALAGTLKDKGYSNAAIAHILRMPESAVRKVTDIAEIVVPNINWGYNCLTAGIHHGRPEAIWNIPLGYATRIFESKELALLVLTRIHKDAFQVAHHNEEFTTEWVSLVRTLAEDKYEDVLAAKRRDIESYYDSIVFRTEMESTLNLLERDKLNPHYEPLHPHDSINMLCRILGTGASIDASRELGIGQG